MPPKLKTMSPPAKTAPQCFRQARPVVAEVVRPVERHAARLEQLDDLGEVLVLPLAGEDFVADDDGANCHGHTAFLARRSASRP
jgi:hypothetical protein